MFKPEHILEAEKLASIIYEKSPKEQQEMMEALKIRLIRLNSQHLEILKK